MSNFSQAGVRCNAGIQSVDRAVPNARARGLWTVEVYDPGHRLIYFDTSYNRVVNEGLDYLLAAGLAGNTPTTSWYIGLTGSTPSPSAGDTLSSHSGWSEVSAYSESNRQAWSAGTVSGQSVSNVNDKARFSINADGTTIGGAFLCAAASGTSGTLYAVNPLSNGDVTLSNGSTIDITVEPILAAS